MITVSPEELAVFTGFYEKVEEGEDSEVLISGLEGILSSKDRKNPLKPIDISEIIGEKGNRLFDFHVREALWNRREYRGLELKIGERVDSSMVIDEESAQFEAYRVGLALEDEILKEKDAGNQVRQTSIYIDTARTEMARILPEIEGVEELITETKEKIARFEEQGDERSIEKKRAYLARLEGEWGGLVAKKNELEVGMEQNEGLREDARDRLCEAKSRVHYMTKRLYDSIKNISGAVPMNEGNNLENLRGSFNFLNLAITSVVGDMYDFDVKLPEIKSEWGLEYKILPEKEEVETPKTRSWFGRNAAVAGVLCSIATFGILSLFYLGSRNEEGDKKVEEQVRMSQGSQSSEEIDFLSISDDPLLEKKELPITGEVFPERVRRIVDGPVYKVLDDSYLNKPELIEDFIKNEKEIDVKAYRMFRLPPAVIKTKNNAKIEGVGYFPYGVEQVGFDTSVQGKMKIKMSMYEMDDPYRREIPCMRSDLVEGKIYIDYDIDSSVDDGWYNVEMDFVRAGRYKLIKLDMKVETIDGHKYMFPWPRNKRILNMEFADERSEEYMDCLEERIAKQNQ